MNAGHPLVSKLVVVLVVVGYILFIYVRVGGACILWLTSEGQRTSCESHLSLPPRGS